MVLTPSAMVSSSQAKTTSYPSIPRSSRDNEIPIEGLRISDYLRELSALPLKASIVVLDARPAATLHRGRQADRERFGPGRTGSAYADRIQRRAGHGCSPRARVLWRLRPGPCRDDPHWRIDVAGGFQSPAAARQRRQQGRAGALGCPERSMPPSCSSICMPDAPTQAAAGPRYRGEQADARSRRAGCLRRGARTRHAVGAMRISWQPIRAIRSPDACARSSPRGAKR